MPDLEGMNYEVGLVPQDINTHNPANWIDMSKHDVCHIVIMCGAMAADWASLVIDIGTDKDGTHDSTYAFDEYYKKTDVSAYSGENATPSGIFTRVTGAAGTFASGATANQLFVIPVHAADLGSYSALLPYRFMRLHIADPANTDLVAVLYVFPKKGAMFDMQIPPTVVGYP